MLLPLRAVWHCSLLCVCRLGAEVDSTSLQEQLSVMKAGGSTIVVAPCVENSREGRSVAVNCGLALDACKASDIDAQHSKGKECS